MIFKNLRKHWSFLAVWVCENRTVKLPGKLGRAEEPRIYM